MSEMHSKPDGTNQLQLKASLPTAESVVGKDKSWPLREQLKKASKKHTASSGKKFAFAIT